MNQFSSVDLVNPAILAVVVEIAFLLVMRLYREILKSSPAVLDRWNDLASILALVLLAGALSVAGQAAVGPLSSPNAVGDALLRALGVAGVLGVGYKFIQASLSLGRGA